MSSVSNPPFAAVLLAGGRSTRMGRDKAAIVVEGRALWERQLATLAALQPAELFISGRMVGPYAGAGVEIIEDVRPGLGPLSGIAAALTRTTMSRTVVLAVDMPAMPTAFLASLVREAEGAIPLRDGRFEPLAAVYPRSALRFAEDALERGECSLQPFARALSQVGLVKTVEIAPGEAAFFRNLNTPEDLAGAT